MPVRRLTRSSEGRRLLLATFGAEEDILTATRRSRGAGLEIVDIFTPYAVHGLNEAMGLKPSRLSWVAFACGALGASLILLFQYWASATSWPLNIGGKPWNSLPAFFPATFEMMVLFAGYGSVIAMLTVSKLFPGQRPRYTNHKISDNEFLLIIEETDAAFDPAKVGALLADCHPLRIEEQVLGDEGVPR